MEAQLLRMVRVVHTICATGKVLGFTAFATLPLRNFIQIIFFSTQLYGTNEEVRTKSQAMYEAK